MKKLFILLIAAGVFQSCAICKPPRNNAEMQQRVMKHDRKPMRASVPVQQRIKQRGDGYWLVYTTRGFAPTTVMAFECYPDTTQLRQLREGTLKVRTEEKII